MLRRQLPFPISFISLILFYFCSLSAGAVTFTVTNLNDSGAGSLRQAILDANALSGLDTIQFTVTGNILLTSGQMDITDQLTINGPGASQLIISADSNSRIFSIKAGIDTTLNAISLQDGKVPNVTPNDGGAIHNEGTLLITNCNLSKNNTYDVGGAVYNSGSLTIRSSTLSANVAGNDGGAIYNYGETIVINSTLSGNTATGSTGGGICSYADSSKPSTLTVMGSTLSGNKSNRGGGGIYNEQHSSSNIARVTITNSTLSGNTNSSYGGGGIRNYAGVLKVYNSTLSNNTSGSYSGGIRSEGSSAVLDMYNSVIAGNKLSSDVESNIHVSSSNPVNHEYNLFGTSSNSGLTNLTPSASDIVLTGLISTAIGPLTDNGGPTQTHLPVAGSPAINAGDKSMIPAGVATDQRGAGYARIVGGMVDIGSVEEGLTPPSTTGGLSFSVFNNASRTTAYAAGRNDLGQLGAGDTTLSSPRQASPQAFFGRSIYPVRIRPRWSVIRPTGTTAGAPLAAVDTTDFIALASGATHTVALHTDGSVWAWGDNANGQLGNGTTTPADQPTAVLLNASTPLTGVIALAAGRDHSVAVKNDGTVWTWGRNPYGQLGDNSEATTTRFYPVQVVIDAALTPLTDVRLVAASDVHTVAVKTDGTVWAWGDNAQGELGTGNTTAQRTAVQVPTLDDAQAILARGTDQSARTIAQRSDGSLWGWGDNRDCQLGEAAPGTAVLTPTRLTNLTNLGVSASNLAQGDAHGLARKRDGAAWSWGNNAQGQLGDGTTTNRCAPVQVKNLSAVETVGAGAAHSFATTGDGAVWGWGSNSEGQLGVGDDLTPHPTPTRMAGENGVGYLNLKAGSGDVNGDGNIDALDVVATINAVLGIQPLPAADVNGDGSVNALDVVYVINRVLGL